MGDPPERGLGKRRTLDPDLTRKAVAGPPAAAGVDVAAATTCPVGLFARPPRRLSSSFPPLARSFTKSAGRLCIGTMLSELYIS